MSLLVNQPWKLLCFRRKPVLVRSSPHLSNNGGFSTSVMQTPPCSIISAVPCGEDLGKLVISNATEEKYTHLEKKVPLELMDSDHMVTIGSSHGWVAILKDDGIVRLQDDFNPVASDTNPKSISLPHLVTLPHCQTKVVTNIAMSSASPEDEDCVVAVKFLGPQLSFCRPAQSNPEWTNIRIENSCFFSSPVMFSKRDDMFRIPGSGGHLIGSWDLHHKHSKTPKLQRLRYSFFPKLTKAKRDLLDSCYTSEHLVESRSTKQIFLVKSYKKTVKILKGVVKMKTVCLMVFKVFEEGTARFTHDIGGLCIFLSKSEPFCVPADSFPGISLNSVQVLDVDDSATVELYAFTTIYSTIYRGRLGAPYHIPPQNIKID